MSILLQTLSTVFSATQRAKRRAFKQLQAGQFVSAVITCDKILRTDPKDTLALRVLADVADAVSAAVERYKREPDAHSEKALRKIRLDYAGLLQASGSALPVAGSPMVKAYHALMGSGLRDLERDAQETAAFVTLRSTGDSRLCGRRAGLTCRHASVL